MVTLLVYLNNLVEGNKGELARDASWVPGPGQRR